MIRCLDKARHAALAIALTMAPLGAAHATLPGENGVIVYQQAGSLFKIAATGTGPSTKIIDQAFYPAVAPNGKQVAFMTSTVNPPQTSIWVVNLDGSNAVQLAQWDGILEGGMSAWSPNGKTLAVSGAWNGTYPVYAIDVASKQRTQLFTTPAWVTRLAWSPLGDKMAYSMNDDGDILGRVIDLATGNRVLLSLYFPSWFPDYTGLLVGTSRSSVPNGNDRCLARQNADGSNYVSSSFCYVFIPTVSPDGTAVLTTFNANSVTHQLAIGDLDGSNLRVISADAQPLADWSRLPKTPMHSTRFNGTWSGASPLGQDSDSYLSEADIAVMPEGAAGDYSRQVVGVGVDGRVYHRAQHISGTWTPYAVVPGGSGSPAGIHAKRVAIAGALDGSAQVVIVGANDIVYHAVRYTNGSWSGFNLVGGYGGAANFAARDVAIAIVNSSTSTPGQAHLVVNGKADGDAYHRIRLDNGSWTAWGTIGNSQTQSLAIAFDASANANAYVLATSPAQGVMRRVRRPDGSWTPWVPMATTAPAPLKGVTLTLSHSSGTAWVGYVGADGAVWSQTILYPTAASSWEQPSMLPVFVMPKGRTVSMGYTLSNGLELVAVQVQPQ